MHEVVLPFIVVMAPTVFVLVLEFLNEEIRKSIWWRIGVAAFGIILSLLTLWQITSDRKTAAQDRERVIKDTSTQVSTDVTKAVTEQFKKTVADQSNQIADLKAQLARQGHDVAVIKSSDIVTGKRPVRVEVTNPSGDSEGSSPHPIISVTSTKFKKDDGNQKLSWTIALGNSTKFPTNARVQCFWYWNDQIIREQLYGPTELAFAPPPTTLELSGDMILKPEAYALFLSNAATLTVKVVAVYPDDYPKKGGSTTYVLEGRAQPNLENISITSTNWTASAK